MKVLETFEISNRGIVVAVDGLTDLPVAKELEAQIKRPDGSVRQFKASKEFLKRTYPEPAETEAFLVYQATKDDIAVGSEIELYLRPDR